MMGEVFLRALHAHPGHKKRAKARAERCMQMYTFSLFLSLFKKTIASKRRCAGCLTLVLQVSYKKLLK